MRCTAWRHLAAVVGLVFVWWLSPVGTAHAWGLVGKQTTEQWCDATRTSCGATALAAGTADIDRQLDAWDATWSGSSTTILSRSGTVTCTGPASPSTCGGKQSIARWPSSAGGGIKAVLEPSSVVYRETTIACPPNSQEADGGCVCSVGFEAEGAQCVGTNCDAVAASATEVGMLQTTGAGVTICAGGCRLAGSVSAQAADGGYWTWGPYSSAGYCAGDPYTGNEAPPIGTPPPIPCPTGQCPGQINGANVCVPCKTTEVKDAGTKTTTNRDGTKTQTKTETKCEGGKCTTTTTTEELDSSGNPIPGTKTETKDEKPEKSFCQENPKSPLCKESSFGGACGGGFNCDGDGIQCAIAREQHKRACEWADVDSALVSAGGDALSGGLRPSDHPFSNASEQSFAFSSLINQTNGITGGCPVNETYVLMGQSLTLPFAELCGPLGIMGNIAVAFALLAAVRIVFH